MLGLPVIKLVLAGAAVWPAVPGRGETVEQLAAMELSLHTGNPITVAERGREDHFYFQLANPDPAAKVGCRLHLTLTDHAGGLSSWTSEPLVVPPNASVKLPLAPVISAPGWWHVRPTLRSVDDRAHVAKPARSLACIEPLGPRDLPPDDQFWFGLDSRDRRPAMLRLFARMGVDILRFGTWSGVNPGRDEWQFEAFDQVVDAIRAEGMQPLYSITFTPPYAVKSEYRGRGDPSRLPPDPEALRDSLQRIIAHTRDRGLSVYDLWNEPDHRGFWRGTTDDYLEFMSVAYQTIKQVQPEATVLSGGIASLHPARTDGLDPDMDRRILLEGRKWYDAIALHEHGPFDRFAEALDGPLAEYRKQLGEDKQLWLTETGYSGEPLETAIVLVQKFTYARAHNARGLVWYAIYPPGQGGGYNIVGPKGDPHPALPAYSHLARRIRGKRFARAYQDQLAADNRLFAFEDEAKTLFIGWGRGPTTHQVPFHLGEAVRAEAFDIMGQRLELERQGNALLLPLTRSPRYLQIDGRADVGAAEAITPLAVFEFGGLQPSPCHQHARVSPLEATGWKRIEADDRDARMSESTSGHPNASFDGEGNPLQIRFTITPAERGVVDFENLGFWGNAGASRDTTVALACRIGDAVPVEKGSITLRNLSTPRTRGEYHSFSLRGLAGISQPVTFTLTASRPAGRVIFKVDDLRVDGVVRRLRDSPLHRD